MHVLASQHYLKRAREAKGQPRWLQRLKKTPSHWSGPAERYMESLMQLHQDIRIGIMRSPKPFRETMIAMHTIILQLQRMMQEGNIRAMVRDEFWSRNCYGMVPINIDDAVSITNRLVEEFKRHEYRALVNDAVAEVRDDRLLRSVERK